MRILNNRRKIRRKILLRKNHIGILIKYIKPVKLRATKHEKMVRRDVRFHDAACCGGDTGSAEETGVLVHAEGGAAEVVGGEFFSSEGADERES